MIGTDTLAERVWNTSPGQPGPEGMLHAYLLGDNAHAWSLFRTRLVQTESGLRSCDSYPLLTRT